MAKKKKKTKIDMRLFDDARNTDEALSFVFDHDKNPLLRIALGFIEERLVCSRCPFKAGCDADDQHDECAFAVLKGFAKAANEGKSGRDLAKV